MKYAQQRTPMPCCSLFFKTPTKQRPSPPAGIGTRWRQRAHRRPDQEPHVGRCLDGEAGAPSRHNINRPSRMRPTSVLLPVHPELTARDLADFHIDATQLEFTDWKTHRGAAITAAPRLMEHQRAVLSFELLNELAGRVGHTDAARVKLDHIAIRV